MQACKHDDFNKMRVVVPETCLLEEEKDERDKRGGRRGRVEQLGDLTVEVM